MHRKASGEPVIGPKKKLGQHFLQDPNIARKIVSLLRNPETPLIEVGPGKGFLTSFLLPLVSELTVVEIDPDCIRLLKQKFPEDVVVLEHDFLTLELEKIYPERKFNIIGNLPYNISSSVFFKLIAGRKYFRQGVFMIQKEVAERICAKPGSRQNGILSILLQSFFSVRYAFSVSEKVFYPKPKVKSAVISLSRLPEKNISCREDAYINLVRTLFQQRRKMIRHSLRQIVSPEGKLRSVYDHPLLSKRPEQLEQKDFEWLTNNFFP